MKNQHKIIKAKMNVIIHVLHNHPLLPSMQSEEFIRYLKEIYFTVPSFMTEQELKPVSDSELSELLDFIDENDY